MIVYEIMECRSFGECYSWGIFSTEENAKLYLNKKGWDKYVNFEIVIRVVDEKLNNLEGS